MRFEGEFEACKTVCLEGIAEFHTAQVKAGMSGPLADVCSLVGGGVSGLILYPLRRITRKSPEMIIQQSKSRMNDLSNY